MNVDRKTLAALDLIGRRLRVRDVGINPERREIYLLGGARTLNSTLRNHLILGWQQRRGWSPEMTWQRLEIVLAEILEETNVPQPGVVASSGPWHEGVTPDGDFVSGWTVIPIPAPGGPQFPWWSARSGHLMEPVQVPRVSLCDEEPLDAGDARGPALLTLPGSSLPPVFLSHGVAHGDLRRAERCGGFLWPSIAATWKIPPSYGDIVMIADARLPTMFLPPTGRRSRKFVFTASDSWSMAGGQLDRLEKGLNWELLGDRAWWNGDRSFDDGGYGLREIKSELLAGSTDVDDLIGGNAPEIAQTPLRSMAQFWRRLKRLVRIHTQRSGVYEYELRDDMRREIEDEGDVYHYLELKVRGVLSGGSFVACLYPRRLGASTNRFLDAVGFRGWRIPFRWDGPLEKDTSIDDLARAEWAAAATSALLQWAEDPCGSAVVPEVLRGDGRPYSAVAEYSLKYDHAFGGHLGWRQGSCGERA